ncbi:MAG TPA: FCD domain-containing protein [Propionibacteriaceae bacterium]|nr:FCD domain-containing protein [Propionibacteriaceae bacterium]
MVSSSAGTEPAKSTSARIAQQIVAQIDAGEYPVGSKLPAETRLASQFGVSRPSVREALRALQFVGYIASVRGSGTTVINTSHSRQAPATPAKITSGEILQLFEARLVLEPSVAATAARDPDLDKLRQAEELIEGMGLVVSGRTLHAETDLLVHRVMAGVCRNVFLRQSLLGLLDVTASDQLASVRQQAWADRELPQVWGEHHQQIVRAIRDRDMATAAETSWQHVASSARNALAVVTMDPALEPAAVSRFIAVLEGGLFAAPPGAPRPRPPHPS